MPNSGESLRVLLRGKRPLVMGIINVTPDSFSGDGVGSDLATAVQQAQRMVAEGADCLDIGGESTRPGSSPVDADTELARVLPVIAAIRAVLPHTPLSIDTSKAVVAARAVQAGVAMINDVSGAMADPAMLNVAATAAVPIVLMHNRARAGQVTGQSYAAPDYNDFMEDVRRDLRALAVRAEAAGVAHDHIILDPGIGFGKTVAQNHLLIDGCGQVVALGYPVLIGASRKSFLGGQPEDRVAASVACAVTAARQGAAILRVHDVKETVAALGD